MNSTLKADKAVRKLDSFAKQEPDFELKPTMLIFDFKVWLIFLERKFLFKAYAFLLPS